MSKLMPDKSLIYPLFIPMQGCPERCIYCDQRKISGAGAFDLDQAQKEVQAFILRNPKREKEIAFYGGSFTALSADYRERILSSIAEVCDSDTSFRISTHPLYIDDSILKHCKKHKVRTIELGIQDWDDDVLKATGRGYTANQAFKACREIQAAGFKLGLQLMPGLPASSEESMLKNRLILNLVRPDLLRLYPLVVIKGTPLAEEFSKGKYQPLSIEEAIDICVDYAELCPLVGVKIIKYGLPSNIEPSEVLAGPYHPAFGELVKQKILYRKICQKPQLLDQLEASQLQLLQAHGRGYLDELRLKKLHNKS